MSLYGKVSSMHIETDVRDGQTYASNIYFTPPLKVTKPFKLQNGGLHFIMMSSSPGIMDEDEQDFKFYLKDGSKLLITSQSFEKIYKSTTKVGAVRRSEIKVGKDAYLKYFPLPTLPYEESIFDSDTEIYLKDDSSKFVMVETIAAGRIARDELFKYDKFKLFTRVYKGEEEIYIDNTQFYPKESNMEGFGYMEGFTHLCNVLIFNIDIDDKLQDEIQKILDDEEGMEGGITKTYTGDHLIRIFGNGGVKMHKLSEKLISMIENKNNIEF